MPAKFRLRTPSAIALVAAGILAVATAARADDSLAARRLQIERLQPAEQQDLLRKQERFAELPLEEQDRLRALQEALDADKNAEKLHQVLVRYHEWLKTLTPTQRAELADLPPKERVQAIGRIQRQQHAAREQAHRAELLSSQDVRAIVGWAEDVAWKRRDRVLEKMPEKQRKNFEKANEQRQRRMLLYTILALERPRRSGGGGALLAVGPGEIERLAAKLSEPARQELTQATAGPAQRKIISGWVGTALHRTEPWHATRKLGPLAGDDLVEFWQSDVPLSQRERLLKMPREQMLEELRGMYFKRGHGDLGLPGGSNPPRLDGRSSDRPKGGHRGKGGHPQEPATPPPSKPDAQSQPEIPDKP